ncbi:MAG TPA: nucleoside triphosphate pyrophosphohydrolase [Lachnospiraceae bacterium]|nr:nucleoside triphosphate pyrophosphohydrolase [Lachnospiraceae bacterium]
MHRGKQTLKDRYGFDDLVEIIRILRSKNGCPWDKVQTHETLRDSMIEEAYEVVEAINNKDMENLCEELGDVLMQVIFHATMEAEKGGFTLEDVYDGISKKMISRHSHIFASDVANTPEDVVVNWEKNKKKEKGYKTQTQVLESIPKALPALTRARKIQAKAADVGFDLENLDEAIKKLEEEIDELKNALNSGDEGIAEEYGDVLFSCVNISRFLGLNPEFALTNSSEKFINRFRYIEETALSRGRTLENLTILDMDQLWEQSKQ